MPKYEKKPKLSVSQRQASLFLVLICVFFSLSSVSLAEDRTELSLLYQAKLLDELQSPDLKISTRAGVRFKILARRGRRSQYPVIHSATIESLKRLLTSDDPRKIKAAAFALGQIAVLDEDTIKVLFGVYQQWARKHVTDEDPHSVFWIVNQAWFEVVRENTELQYAKAFPITVTGINGKLTNLEDHVWDYRLLGYIPPAPFSAPLEEVYRASYGVIGGKLEALVHACSHSHSIHDLENSPSVAQSVVAH